MCAVAVADPRCPRERPTWPGVTKSTAATSVWISGCGATPESIIAIVTPAPLNALSGRSARGQAGGGARGVHRRLDGGVAGHVFDGARVRQRLHACRRAAPRRSSPTRTRRGPRRRGAGRARAPRRPGACRKRTSTSSLASLALAFVVLLPLRLRSDLLADLAGRARPAASRRPRAGPDEPDADPSRRTARRRAGRTRAPGRGCQSSMPACRMRLRCRSSAASAAPLQQPRCQAAARAAHRRMFRACRVNGRMEAVEDGAAVRSGAPPEFRRAGLREVAGALGLAPPERGLGDAEQRGRRARVARTWPPRSPRAGRSRPTGRRPRSRAGARMKPSSALATAGQCGGAHGEAGGAMPRRALELAAVRGLRAARAGRRRGGRRPRTGGPR